VDYIHGLIIKKPILEKLNRILVSKEWEDIFPNSLVKRLPCEISDHNPLILASEPNKPMAHIQFRFQLSWLSNPDFIPIVEKIWNKPCRAKSALDKIQQKLKLFKQYFKGWGFNLQGNLRKQRESISEELAYLESVEQSVGLNAEEVTRKVCFLSEFF